MRGRTRRLTGHGRCSLFHLDLFERQEPGTPQAGRLHHRSMFVDTGLPQLFEEVFGQAAETALWRLLCTVWTATSTG